MTFLNPAILVALFGVGIPILIHLLHRRRPRTTDWGAMQFLLDSLAARRKRILLEEMLLMAMRCLLIALLVLAAARPFVPAGSRVPWLAVLPAALAASVCFGLGVVMWSRRRVALGLLGLAALLLVGAGAAALLEHRFQSSRWTAGAGARDVAIVIDGSTSMEAVVEGQSSFERAVEEARAAAGACGRDDKVGIIVAGAMPVSATPGLVSDPKEIKAALDSVTPVGGIMSLPDTLAFAASLVDDGQNPGKQIVLITDGQAVGWKLDDEPRWRFAASTLEQLPRSTRVLCRLLPLPRTWDNAAVAEVTPARRVVGVGRPVELAVHVQNTGSVPTRGLAVHLTVDGATARTRHLSALSPGASETVTFRHRFARPGPHVVTAELAGDDDLPADNSAVRVVNVLDSLPVLLVGGGAASSGAGDGTLTARLALAPGEESRGEGISFVTPRAITPAQLDAINLRDHRVVLLAGLSRLSAQSAERLRQFVRDGGGLLVAPPANAEAESYNGWEAPGGGPMLPAALAQQVSAADPPARPLLQTCTHPALRHFAGSRSDAASATVRHYWQLEPHAQRGDVRVGGELDTGAPLMVEGRVGRGSVILMPFSLGRRETNLPSLASYVPLLHELAYHLSAPAMPEFNVRPGTQVFLPAPEADDDLGPWRVLTPTGNARTAATQTTAGGTQLTFAGTARPGLYRFQPAADPEASSVPFVVLRDPEESRLDPLTEEELLAARDYVPFLRPRDARELVTMMAGGRPGREVWKQLLLCALLVLLVEMALARWITVTRRAHTASEVEFGEQPRDHGRLRGMFGRRPSRAQASGGGE